ncbi:MAG: bifunctional homocysteine S-methyltransferase/methylenetetrahydrofolate reductase [Lachnospira sp.]|nr:bifunctional homocysteine S-methyltransferase/methylenetetrahydrofolate reductase [Lachnospira sp.]
MRGFDIRGFVKDNILITDGAFGTYYADVYDTQELPELANDLYPERVSHIHNEYVKSGAKLIRTNTYASNSYNFGTDIERISANIKKGCELAIAVADKSSETIYVAGDIGPIHYDNFKLQAAVQDEYCHLVRTMVESGVDAIVFETFADMDDIVPAIELLKEYPEVCLIVQFSVNQFGYSNSGLSARKLLSDASDIARVDAVGLNCGVGPAHMQKILSKIALGDKCITALPNAGYPQMVSNRMVFASDNALYFAKKAKDIIESGVRIIGGCCGTTPDYIKELAAIVKDCPIADVDCNTKLQEKTVISKDNAFYKKKLTMGTTEGKLGNKLIAVELAPPLDSDDEKLMEAAHILEKSGVDVVTFPDSPSGRTRADSILMAEKVAKETGLCVMPHLCCRDKNAIAIRSQLLGAHINDINNFLVITGDPVPGASRQTVKSVFNFDSVGLMNIIKDMNSEQFVASNLCFGGAINQNRTNMVWEIGRVKKKMNAGATFFMTQPVFDESGAMKLKKFKEETNATILCGIMPFVSLRNALFMKNEMKGIEVSDEVIERYKTCISKEDGEAVGVQIAKEVIALTKDFVDGYYFSFPFNRVYLLEQILN